MVYLKTKNPIWVYLGGPWNGKCLYILQPFGTTYDHLAVWYNLWQFGILFPFWFVWTKKTWQPWL
jgi:hypothetical protein